MFCLQERWLIIFYFCHKNFLLSFIFSLWPHTLSSIVSTYVIVITSDSAFIFSTTTFHPELASVFPRCARFCHSSLVRSNFPSFFSLTDHSSSVSSNWLLDIYVFLFILSSCAFNEPIASSNVIVPKFSNCSIPEAIYKNFCGTARISFLTT